jgi:hypothetical protein
MPLFLDAVATCDKHGDKAGCCFLGAHNCFEAAFIECEQEGRNCTHQDEAKKMFEDCWKGVQKKRCAGLQAAAPKPEE